MAWFHRSAVLCSSAHNRQGKSIMALCSLELHRAWELSETPGSPNQQWKLENNLNLLATLPLHHTRFLFPYPSFLFMSFPCPYFYHVTFLNPACVWKIFVIFFILFSTFEEGYVWKMYEKLQLWLQEKRRRLELGSSNILLLLI